MTLQALLADRAKAALQLPGRYIPMADGTVIDAAPAWHKDDATPAALEATAGSIESPQQPERMECLPESPRTSGTAKMPLESPQLSDNAACLLELPRLPDCMFGLLPDNAARSSESPRLPNDTGNPSETSQSASEASAGTAASLSNRARRRAFIKARKRHKGHSARFRCANLCNTSEYRLRPTTASSDSKTRLAKATVL